MRRGGRPRLAESLAGCGMAGTVLLFGLVGLCSVPSASGQVTYEYFVYYAPHKANGRVTQSNAREYCVTEFGGELASITSQTEYNLIQRHVSTAYPGENIWIGGERTGTEASDENWRWTDDSDFVSSFNGVGNWAPGEPSNSGQKENCMILKGNSMQWNDNRCKLKRLGLCKRVAQTSAPTPAPPPTTRPTMAPTATARPWAGWVGRNPVGEDSETCYYRYFNLVINKTLTRPALQRRTWSQARDFCAAQAKDMTPGGAFTPHLVSIYDEAENQFVSNLVTVEYRDLPNRPVWIGAHDTTHEHDFHWPNGDAVQYRNFPLAEPNNYVSDGIDEDCVQMNHALKYAPGQWNDAWCMKKRGWICKVCV